MKPSDSKHFGDRAATPMRRLLILSVAIALVLLLVPTPESNAQPNDFAFYWTAARLVLEGRNPYSPQETVELEKRLSFPGKGRLVLLNPPWVLPLIVPFGLLSYSIGKFFWFLFSLILMLISVQWLWEFYASGKRRWVGWLVAAAFLPVSVVLSIGQIGPFLLFGLAGFLRFQARQNHYLAGAFLYLPALKPHLVFLFWLALLLDALSQRKWKPLVGLSAMIAAASATAVLLNPGAFQQYAGFVSETRVVFLETPTLGGLLRHISGRPWVQLLPPVIATLWLAAYWARWRSEWDWRQRLPMLLLVSVAATCYAWFFDQVVLLPSVFNSTVLVMHSPRRVSVAVVIAYFATNCFIFLLLLEHRAGFYYSWTALAWLVLAVIVGRNLGAVNSAQPV